MNTSHGASKPTPISLQVGPYRAHALPTGIFGLDGGAMFGTVPKVLWEKTNPADEQNRIELEARVLLLESDGRKILVDCGIGGNFIAKYGEKLGGKFAEIYGVEADDSESTALSQNIKISIEKNLNARGIRVEEITDVILTHLHFDHAGGATCERGGRLVPTFPKATYYIQHANLETAENPNLREKASYYSANFAPLIEAGVLKILNGPVENLLPGISVLVTNGHTTGQQIVKIAGPTTTIVYCGDLIPTTTHVKLPWVMGYDLDPLTLMEEKRALLTLAAKQGWYLFFEHDPYADAALVTEAKGDFAVRERFKVN